jgi:hypothetical protein
LNHKDLQRELELVIGQRGLALMDELWPLLVSAVAAPDGIPRQLKDAAEQAAAELVSTTVQIMYYGIPIICAQLMGPGPQLYIY